MHDARGALSSNKAEIQQLMNNNAASVLCQPTMSRGSAYAALVRDQNAFDAEVQRIKKEGPDDRATVLVGHTPLVLNILGVDRSELRISEVNIDKIVNGKHSDEMPSDVFGRVLALMSDPAAIVQSSHGTGSLEVLLNETDKNGDPIITIVRKKKGSIEFHTLASVYGKDKVTDGKGQGAEAWIKKHLEAGDFSI